MAHTLRLLALLAIAPAATAQVTGPSPRQLLDLARPLTAAEMSIVLKGVQEAIDGKTFRLSAGNMGSGIQVLMGPGGFDALLKQAVAAAAKRSKELAG